MYVELQCEAQADIVFSSFGQDLSLILYIGSVHLDRKRKVLVTHLTSYTVS